MQETTGSSAAAAAPGAVTSIVTTKCLSSIFSDLTAKPLLSASFVKYESPEEARPIDIREDVLKFAEQYGLNGEFVRRVQRYEAFKTFKNLIKQIRLKEAAQYAKEHEFELLQYAENGERPNDRWGCRLLLLLVAAV